MAATYDHARTRSSRNHFMDPPTLSERLCAALPDQLPLRARHLVSKLHIQRLFNDSRRRRWSLRDLANLPTGLILLWAIVLLWGERWVFQSAVKECSWHNWERWPREATPHHLILIADPQLVDPHTYTGRPWPLSTLTEKHTDNYLRRSYKALQTRLTPDTIFFLGDLFDGGREWVTDHGTWEDPAWDAEARPKAEKALLSKWHRYYTEDFWLKEYARFGSIFFDLFKLGDTVSREGRDGKARRIIAGLPGNHDLGIGADIKIPVRERFQTYFGESNRVDVIANHTFVSIDGVSLSAGSDKEKLDNYEVYGPVEEFLKDVAATKRRALARELRARQGKSEIGELYAVANIPNNPASIDPGPSKNVAELPTILLTHVPLFRNPGVQCGPLRERHPPSAPAGEPDEGNAIPIQKGYQYQNVLSQADSARVLGAVGNVRHVFSGDDHDYCEIVHTTENSGYMSDGTAKGDKGGWGVREVTVKSMSWAMGVRRPGFEMVSLWNPVDGDGRPLGTKGGGHGAVEPNGVVTTIETKMCLLPDQIAILLRYVTLLIITIGALVARAVATHVLGWQPTLPGSAGKAGATKARDEPLLPMQRDYSRKRDRSAEDRYSNASTASSASMGSNQSSASLAPRTTTQRTRSVSPGGGYGIPASQASHLQSGETRRYMPPSFEDEEEEKNRSAGQWETVTLVAGGAERMKERGVLVKVGREVLGAVARVAWPVLLWFGWLCWYG